MRLTALRGCARRGSLTALAVAVAFAALSTAAPRAGAISLERLQGEWIVERLTIHPATPADIAVGLGDLGAYRGTVELRPGADGGIDVLNDVPFDDYLRGISEIPASWPSAALEAQAIAARTFALSQLGGTVATAYRAAGADLCATEACQVYRGLARESQELGSRWRAAVDATDDLVLLHRGAPIVAKYSSSNGGRTVPGGRPYLGAVDDPDDAVSPQHRWTSALALEDVTARLGLPGLADTVSRNGDAVVLEGLAHDGSRFRLEFPVLDFRAALNQGPPPAGLPRTVPSVQFDAVLADGRLTLAGRGYGHGIGMSQYGALGKAQRGLDAAEILAAYYGGLRPVPAPPGLVPERIRVALALGTDTVAVAGAGAVRLVDHRGSTIAALATGPWTVSPAPGGRLRVEAPDGAVLSPRETARPVTPLLTADRAVSVRTLPAGRSLGWPVLAAAGLLPVVALATWRRSRRHPLH